MGTASLAIDPAPAATVAPTFADPELQRRMEIDGYVVLSLLDAAEVAEARAAYERFHPGAGRPAEGTACVTDYEQASTEAKTGVAAAVAPIYERHFPGLLVDHRPILVSYVMKWPGDNSDMGPHQDWTYVDERKYRSVTFWTALDDASAELDNGPLTVVPGSHRLVESWRGTRTPSWYALLKDYLIRHGVTVPVKAGDVVIIDNRLIHFSPVNNSAKPRLALAAGAAPAAAGLLHPVDLGDGMVKLVDVDPEFYLRWSPAALWELPPEDAGSEIVPQVRQPLDAGELVRRYGEAAPPAALAEARAQERPVLGGSEPTQRGLGFRGHALALLLRANYKAIRKALPETVSAFAARDDVPWLTQLEAATAEIRQEYLAQHLVLPRMSDVAGEDMPVVGRWQALVLRENGGWIPLNQGRFPRTVRALEPVPGLRSATFSVLDPGAEIQPHRGANNGVLRVHLGIVVPDPPGSCALEAGPDWVPWREGVGFAFDDTWEHRVHNRAREPRVSLMLEVDRQVPGWAGRLNRLVQPMFRLHPQVRGARQRIADLDQALNG